ncbi:MAG: filamentous hemagglutinin N-terminal domain-containing protein, partial [Candidatus Methylumidiphilus sp.]
MDIQQGTAKAVLDWQTFNIGAQAQVNFHQPDASSVALNRVAVGNASVIEGRLTANGQVFLVNPSGVLFGKNAQVDVGGLVATTMNISNADFNRGDFRFTRDGSDAEVVNQGRISARDGGYVALLGATVRNEGAIRANGGGTVALAAGDGVRLAFGDGRLVNIEVDPATIKTLIENKQLVQAQDGRVLMTAVAASRLQGAVINNAGAVEANSISSRGGVIRLSGAGEISNTGVLDASGNTAGGTVDINSSATISQAGRVRVDASEGEGGSIALAAPEGIDNTGSLDASGATAGGSVSLSAAASHTGEAFPLVRQAGVIKADAFEGRGGKIILTGEHLQLDDGSVTSATGSDGGGEIYAGGGKQSASTGISIASKEKYSTSSTLAGTAKTLTIADGAKMDASATNTGNGGIIIGRSADKTVFGGIAKAEGGINGGEGGFVETSGNQLVIDPKASVSTLAAKGKTGAWLLDPNDFTIAASGGNISGTTLSSNLANTNVAINTASQGNPGGNGDINVNDKVSWASNTLLTLQAERNINVNSDIVASGNKAGLSLSYGLVSGNGYFLNNGAKINLSGIEPSLKIGTTGSEASYTVINSLGVEGDTSPTTLQGLQYVSNLSGNYALGSDIDATPTATWNSGAGFNPIGSGTNSTTSFKGNFDGLGHVISGLTINRPSSNDTVGLFGTVGREINSSLNLITHVGLTDAKVTGKSFV